jgi:hypothetical protein
MTIKVTVNLISAEQFGLNPAIQPQEDQQRLLLWVPQTEPNSNVVVPAAGGIEVIASEDSQPLSYAVPQLTGGW